MAARRGKSQARRNSGNATPGWVWLVAGAAIAAVVFLAAPNLFKKEGDGFLRVGPQPNPDAQPAPVADADIDAGADLPRPAAHDGAQPAEKPAATQYDFYTLLPGKEVQMSDAELAASARAEEQRRAQAARTAETSEAQRAQAALEGRPVPPAAAPLPAPISEAPRPAV
ncbi:sporulation protein, partial [Stenotrophomonas acidaminiphila]|nr:sporulation protein [Stenotrophomonas acidaminiphila]